ncbi:MAG: glycosyltransferase family 4 protein [Pelotomaculum sp.]|nr:glycosyltransferase family 4 protein [Pelotomaculum sp.]
MTGIKDRTLWIINHHAGGPGRHESFARELESRGWRVRLFASSFIHNLFLELKDYRPGSMHLMEKLRGVDRVWIKTPPYRGNGLSRLLNHLAFAWRVTGVGLKLEPPGAIIGSSAHLFTGLAAYLLARKHRVPFIFEIRDIWPQSLIDIGAVHRLNPLAVGMGALEKFLYRKARLIISVLPGGGEHVAGLGIDRRKVVYIPNGVDLAWYDRCAREKSLTPEQAALFRKIKGSMVAVYAGAHGYANGLETVTGAAAILQRNGVRDVHIVLVGGGPCKARLVQAAREQGLANVTFLDPVEKSQVPAILKNADVCLFHLRNSRAYRFGLSSNKLFDYMAAARPLIAAVDIPPLPGFSRFGVHIPSDDPAALAGAILHMAGMPPEARRKMGLCARRYVERFHDVPVLADRLAEAVENL